MFVPDDPRVAESFAEFAFGDAVFSVLDSATSP